MNANAFFTRFLDADRSLLALARLKRGSVGTRILIGVIGAGAALAMRAAGAAFYGEITGFMILLPGVILAALAGGRLSGATAVFTALIGGWVVVRLSAGSGAGMPPGLSVVATVNFIIVGLFCAWLGASLRRALARLDAVVSALSLSNARVDETEDRLHIISELAPVMLWMTDAHGDVIHLNNDQRLFWGDADLRTFDADAILHPDDRDRLLAVSRQANAALTGYVVEGRHRRQDGEWRVLRTEARPRLNAAGEFMGMIGVNIDVTDARAAEAALRDSETRFRLLADTAPVLIWVTDQNRQRAFVNQAYVAYFGADYETARAADWRASLHPDDVERILAESIAGEATGEPFSLEARYRRHDGEWRWLKSFSRPRLAGKTVIGFVGVAFDVTDMREAQARLAESEVRFRTVADSAPALIWMTDDSAKLVFSNKRYRRFFGIRSQKQLADAWRRLVHPDDEAVFEAAFIRAFRARDRFEALSRVNHPTLGLRWIRAEGVPRFDAAGGFQGYVGASLDVTDAKRAEDDLKHINELLEVRVAEALEEKAAAEAHLMHAQRMEAVGRLTGGVAHDFNNLLTVVIGALDIILRSNDPAKTKKLGEAALAAARRGESLTHQLLAFSRRQALRPEALDLNGLIREGEPLLRRAVGEAVDFKVKLKRGGAPVKVDPAQFEAALLNLVVNARDALGDVTGGKGARITIQTMNCVIEAGQVAELAPGDYVCVTVSDNGSGMSAEVIDRVFEPFFTTKPVGKGTGLGLSQVYGFARQSGGGVHVISTVGRGAEVRLYLPPLLAEDLPSPVAASSTGERASTRGGRMLLVEDDASVAAVALDLLEGFGLEVQLAESGPDALEALRKARFDLMLTDIVMPGGMSGIDLARQAAQDWPEMRIALTSGYVGDDVDQVLAGSPWPFLRKPYSTEQLRSIVDGCAAPSAES
ncbi:hybrid sensor histidine kinase/response regulator [Brevundimonas sp. SL130]|uniref:hybrid sensor histidine kinase/response regulator n=1 Tax=Brevundimonas sp. SL130 TaxID=2995143 RepID=UPI00226D2CF5|nr:PAS domain-containing sensor histidine kinase [Brevundimonas sp. SL130]WAC59350.1 PAS domain S-box protein [Brevundimonas sp. SL130]